MSRFKLFGGRFINPIKKFLSFINSLFRLLRSRQLIWLINIYENKFKQIINALYSGISMNKKGMGDIYNFRRNIHRLEKGLTNRQPKGYFAEDYILQTLSYLSKIKSYDVRDQTTIDWGEAVINQYFNTCKHTWLIAEAYKHYQRIEPEISHQDWQPYPEGSRPEISIGFDALYQLALRRRSVRCYLDKPVEFKVVKEAMRIAALSPSACNRQAFRFLFYNEQTIVKKIAEIPGGIDGYELPSIIVVTGSYRAYFDERDAHLPIIDASLATMAFEFALETLGLSSICINWPCLPDMDHTLRKLIHLEDDEFVVMLIGIGYPDPEGMILYSAKKDVNELIICNGEIKTPIDK